MEFLKSNELELNAAGYLVSTVSKKPVTHSQFVEQQKNAEFIIHLSVAIQGKKFNSVKPDSLEAIMDEVRAKLNATEVVQHVTLPEVPKRKITDQLKNEALDFITHLEDTESAKEVNNAMMAFNKIYDVEKAGEYFTEGLVKLNKIYTIAEILAAVKETQSIID
jgi:hypothetical protein